MKVIRMISPKVMRENRITLFEIHFSFIQVQLGIERGVHRYQINLPSLSKYWQRYILKRYGPTEDIDAIDAVFYKTYPPLYHKSDRKLPYSKFVVQKLVRPIKKRRHC